MNGADSKFRDTAADLESNFGEIIATAANTAVLWGSNRRLSGSICNARPRWMDDEGDPVEYSFNR